MGEVELLQGLFDQVGKMAADTHAFLWAVRRSLILDAVAMALIGVITLLNFWMLHRALRVVRDILNLVKELIDERTR